MKLIKITKKGSLHFRLSDGRLGVCYESGYVRVQTKGRNMYHGRKTMYQINKQVKVITKSSYFYKRQLITNCVDRVQCLLNFDNNNCQPKPYEYNTRYGR